jgi:IclR family transcriptional regulator, pca regulon regulatory protein
VPVKDRSGTVVASLTTSLNLAKHELDSIVPTFLSKLQTLAFEIGSGLAE